MTRIGIDIQGGDYAPEVVWQGLELALPELKAGTELNLYGLEADATRCPEGHRYHLCSQAIEMGEHPVKALQQKQDATLIKGVVDLAQKKIDSFASAGHSGALMVASMQILGLQEGISRPVVVSLFPRIDGGQIAVLDVGINVDAKAEQFLEFAQLGASYAKAVLAKPEPKIALLNTGAEESKGSVVYKRAHELLKESVDGFSGNMEARDFFQSDVDVLLCDGFTGNIILKQTESFYTLSKELGLNHEFLNRLDYENYGASPIMGVRGKVLLAHGASGPRAIKNMILGAESIALANFVHS